MRLNSVSNSASACAAEHHYRYDPDKSVAYVATTLAWVGDPAAESYAREIITRLKPAESTGKSLTRCWPGGSRELSAGAWRLPLKPREMNDISLAPALSSS